jgi:hypothetical protein
MAGKIYDRPLKAVNELPAGPDKSGLPWWRPILLKFIEEGVKNSRQIFGGVAGAVAGFVATLLILELTSFVTPADPITRNRDYIMAGGCLA